MDQVKINTLVKMYIKMRDARAELEVRDREIKAQMEEIEAELLERCKELGTSGFPTEYGTVTKKVSTRYWTSDWAGMYSFMEEHKVLDLLEKRISQTNMGEFLKDNPDLHPPGLNSTSKYTIVVRRT